MQAVLADTQFSYVSGSDKEFICAFDEQMRDLGYTNGDHIGRGYCWGRHMIIYSKAGVKTKKVVARIYLRDNSTVLRLFLSGIDKHRDYIERAPRHIRDVFTSDQGLCHNCPQKPEGKCQFRKSYTLDNRRYDKCSGIVFEFEQPQRNLIEDYLGLLLEFYPARTRRMTGR